MSTGPNLPQDITIEILSRLPAKPLCTFKSVSKPWQALISDTHFIQRHLNFNIHNNKLVIISSTQHSLYSIEFDDDHTYGIGTNLKFSHPDQWVKIMGSCNGLLFAVNFYNNYFLLNPSTRESVRFPGLPHAVDPGSVRVIHGFGYDRSSSDYKVIAITHKHIRDDDNTDDTVDVYSVKSKEWRSVGKSFYDYPASVPWQGVFLNGYIHWLAYRNGVLVIAAFDLAHEVFDDLPAQAVSESKWVSFYDLLVLGGCLCVVACSQNWLTDIWIMKEYGNGESWIKYTISRRDLYPIKPFGLLREKELLLQVYGEKMVKYDLVQETVTNIVVNGIPDDYEVGSTCVESLVSPHGV